ncbi:high frequency lysogenization protein HflD [uncultured Thalassolituus sp.]|uniref:high frequency lysogenization protein HflD n=1 Tax=uncultured Thalassolituus sp. TaxID=285273 RepID=UPI00260A97C3|nr:high frequency lysogenization protein HflD [uncultured Thalassolituus sp.]
MRPRAEQQAIALAALFQAATLVEELARTGELRQEMSTPLIKSLFEQDPSSFDDIYGPPADNLRLGLEQLLLACHRTPRGINPDVTRYALSLLHLERKLQRSPGMMDALGTGINQASRQAMHFSENHENTLAALADLYKQTLSQLSFRIRVTGNPTHLQSNKTADKVRTLLLAGIRAAILWRQVGGRRWQLLISRKRYGQVCDHLLSQR